MIDPEQIREEREVARAVVAVGAPPPPIISDLERTDALLRQLREGDDGARYRRWAALHRSDGWSVERIAAEHGVDVAAVLVALATVVVPARARGPLPPWLRTRGLTADRAT